MTNQTERLWRVCWRWPKGRYNGLPIVGARVSLALRLHQWFFIASFNYGQPYLIVGPIQLRFRIEYGEPAPPAADSRINK